MEKGIITTNVCISRVNNLLDNITRLDCNMSRDKLLLFGILVCGNLKKVINISREKRK